MKDSSKKEVKCVIWDLDNTLWQGTLLESDNIKLRKNIRKIIIELDKRGILHSIASKNNYDDAIKKIKEFELEEYFLYPKINWNAKSLSIKSIQKELNIGMDSILFIDDQEFERDEVISEIPEITCLDCNEIDNLLKYPKLNPKFITVDSKLRRKMYQDENNRKIDQEKFEGTSDDFLATLNLEFFIHEAKEEDLKRAEELTVRTHQLNATGVTYNYQELDAFRKSDDHLLLVCELKDIYGSYGKIGIALIEKKETYWTIKLLLMSCRVMSRGVGTVLLTYIMNKARKENVRLLADFKKTDRNRMMYISYKFANFKEIEKTKDGSDVILMESNLSIFQDYPEYITLKFKNTEDKQLQEI